LRLGLIASAIVANESIMKQLPCPTVPRYELDASRQEILDAWPEDVIFVRAHPPRDAPEATGNRATSRVLLVLATALVLSLASSAQADVLDADPNNYKMLLQQLEPGDTLSLAPGTYPRLTIQNARGTVGAPIVVTGPERGDPAVVVGESGFNTVQLYSSAHVTIHNLVVDVQGLAVDAINAKTKPSTAPFRVGADKRSYPRDPFARALGSAPPRRCGRAPSSRSEPCPLQLDVASRESSEMVNCGAHEVAESLARAWSFASAFVLRR
jgi:hypothetical protein